MGTFIIKLDGLYLEWSSVSDSPVTFGMTREQFERRYLKKHGTDGMRDLPDRMARVEAKGTSPREDDDVDDTIWLNRAGPGQTPLSKPEIVEWYCRRKKEPTAAEIKAHRAKFPKCDPCIDDNGDGTGQRCVCWGSGVRETAT